MNELRRLLLPVALILSACATPPAPVALTPDPAPEPATPPVTEPPAVSEPSEAEREREAMEVKRARRITIAAVGDMMIGTDYPDNRLPDDDGVSFLAEVATALSSADLTIGNLEGVLVAGGEPGKKCTNPSA